MFALIVALDVLLIAALLGICAHVRLADRRYRREDAALAYSTRYEGRLDAAMAHVTGYMAPARVTAVAVEAPVTQGALVATRDSAMA